MGRCPNNKAGGRQKKYTHKQARRSKFLKKDILATWMRPAPLPWCLLCCPRPEPEPSTPVNPEP